MDDVTRAPRSPFFGSSHDTRQRFERAVAMQGGAEPEQVAEALVGGAEPAALLEAEQWAELTPEVRFASLLQLAWLAAERDDDELTLACAERALELKPADEGALAMAEPLWLEAEAFTELADHYALAATATESAERARQLLERALHMLESTPAAAPALVGLSERLAQLPRLREGEATLLAVLQSGSAEAEGAIQTLAERWLNEGRAREGAVLVPRDLRAFTAEASLDSLERLFDQAEDVERLAAVLRRRVEAAAGPEARGRALEKLAELEHERRADLAAAAGTWLAAGQAFVDAGEYDDAERMYERLLQVMPEHLNAAARLVSLRAAAGNFAGAAESFTALLSSEPPAPEAGELLLGVAADAERACAADEFSELVDSVRWRLPAEEQALSGRLLRESARLFAAQARYDEAAEAYRRLLAEDATTEDVLAFQALIDAHPATDWRQSEQRWLFEWREYHEPDRSGVLREWARFEEAEGDPSAAAAVLSRAAELSPEDAHTWRELSRLRLAGGDGEGGLAAAERLQDLGHEPPPELLDAVLELEPSTRWAVDRRKLSLSAEKRFAELFELYDRAIASASDAEERAAWLDEAAIAARDVVRDRRRAVDYWEACAELVPDDARVALALERLYEQSGDRRALLQHLGRRRARSTPEQQLCLDQRIVQLSLEVGEVNQALAAALRAQARCAAEAEPLLEATFARCVEQWRDANARVCGQECAEQLRVLYTEAGRFDEVARLLRAELSLELGHRQRCARLTALSRLCEQKLADLPAAFDAARAAFLATCGRAERNRLEKLARKLGAWSALIDTYLEATDSELSRSARRRLLERAADVAIRELGDPACAARCYEAVFGLEPDQALTAYASLEGEPAAFEALCRVLSRARRFEELAQALRSRASATGDAELYSRLGRVLEGELNDPRAAIDAHLLADDARAAAEVFLEQPSVYADDSAPVVTLAARLDTIGLAEDSVRVLRHQLAHYGEQFPPARKPAQLALVNALKATGSADAAEELLAEATRRYPSDAEVQLASAAAAAAREDWARAEHGYRTLLLLLHGQGAGRAEVRRATVYVELAALELRRGDEAAAAQWVESGFEAALNRVDELVALTRALVAHQVWPAAERAVALLRRAAEHEPKAQKAALLVEVAELLGAPAN